MLPNRAAGATDLSLEPVHVKLVLLVVIVRTLTQPVADVAEDCYASARDEVAGRAPVSGWPVPTKKSDRSTPTT